MAPHRARFRYVAAAAGGAIAMASLLAGGVAAAAPPSPTSPAAHTAGYIPARGQVHTACCSTGAGNLLWHNGPVMHANTVYAIYWVPGGYSVSGTYESTINKFFTDVATAGANATDVYAIDNQYTDGSGSANSGGLFFGGSVVDTSALPPNGCTDSYTSVCLSDAQIQSEITKDVTAQKWPTTNSFFVMFTAAGIGSCSGSSCAFSNYCAYHGDTSTGLMYANMPYADTVPNACDTGQYPNHDAAADSEINVTSHEQNETITDPQLNAWYDRRGYEIGDKCAWHFGTVSGTSGTEYNQTINGDEYYIQQEWSNKISACALHG